LTVLLSRDTPFVSAPGSGRPTPAEIARADRENNLAQLAERVRREHALGLSEVRLAAKSGSVASSPAAPSSAPGTDAAQTSRADILARLERCAASVDRARARYSLADDRPMNDLELQRLQCEFELELDKARTARIGADRRHDVYLRIAWLGGVPSLGILLVAAVLRRGRQAASPAASR